VIKSWDHSIRNIHNTRRDNGHVSFHKFKDLIIREEKQHAEMRYMLNLEEESIQEVIVIPFTSYHSVYNT
jgi:hypothetical protein